MKTSQFFYTYFIVLLLSTCFAPVYAADTPVYTAEDNIADVYYLNQLEYVEVEIKKFSLGKSNNDMVDIQESPGKNLEVMVVFEQSEGKEIIKFFKESDSNKCIEETDDNGFFNFVISTKGMEESFKGTLKISCREKKGEETDNDKEYKDVIVKEIEIKKMADYAPVNSDRVASEIFVGASFTNEYDDNGESSGINEEDKLIWVKLDSLFTWPKCHLHLDTAITLNSYLSVKEEEPGAEKKDEKKEAKKLADAAILSSTVLIQPEFMSAYYSSFTGRTKDKYDAFKLGFFIRPIFITRDSKNVEGDTNIFAFQSGLSLRYHQTESKKFVKDVVNKMPRLFLEVADGWYEEFAQNKYHHRFIANAGFSLLSEEKSVLPLYAGFQLNVGEGEDELKFYVGLLYKIEQINKVFKELF